MNNSVINVTAIGATNTFLVCYTDLVDCCRSIDNAENRSFGSIKLPDGSAVNSNINANSSIYSSSRSKQAVVLHRESNALGPSGIYTCNIPDVHGTNRKIYFGIYDRYKGMYKNCL